MTKCKNCRALYIRQYKCEKGYYYIPAVHDCALGHKVKDTDEGIVCADCELCKDKTTRVKKQKE